MLNKMSRTFFFVNKLNNITEYQQNEGKRIPSEYTFRNFPDYNIFRSSKEASFNIFNCHNQHTKNDSSK